MLASNGPEPKEPPPTDGCPYFLLATRAALRNLTFSLAIVIAMAFCNGATAANICQAVVTYDTPSLDEPANTLKAGDFDTAIYTWRVSKKTGESSVCSDRGSCYPTSVLIDGKMVEAMILTNCRVGRLSGNDLEYKYYDVVAIPERIAPKELLEDQIEDRLLGLSVPRTQAISGAETAVYAPKSACGRAVFKAIKGGQQALKQLQEGDELIRCVDTADEIAKSRNYKK